MQAQEIRPNVVSAGISVLTYWLTERETARPTLFTAVFPKSAVRAI